MIHNSIIQHVGMILWQSIHMQAMYYSIAVRYMHIYAHAHPVLAFNYGFGHMRMYIKESQGAPIKFCNIKSTLTAVHVLCDIYNAIHH